MDRLDAWLNSQAGWRHVLFVWVQVCPWVAVLGWFLWGFMTPGVPGLGLVTVEILALAVFAAILVARLIAARRMAAIRTRLILSWRLYIGSLFFSAGVLVGQFVGSQPVSWNRAHQQVQVLWLVCYAAAVAFACWAGQRWRLARRTVPASRDHESSVQASS